jgi:hypothetical protein
LPRDEQRHEPPLQAYKRIVRILKCLRPELANAGKARDDAPSCFLEHAVINAPMTDFNKQHGAYYEDAKAVLRFLWNAARNGSAKKFVAVSGMEWLFRQGGRRRCSRASRSRPGSTSASSRRPSIADKPPEAWDF